MPARSTSRSLSRGETRSSTRPDSRFDAHSLAVHREAKNLIIEGSGRFSYGGDDLFELVCSRPSGDRWARAREPYTVYARDRLHCCCRLRRCPRRGEADVLVQAIGDRASEKGEIAG